MKFRPSNLTRKILFIFFLLFLLIIYSSPPLGLGLGLLFGLFLGNPFQEKSKYFSKILLQLCVVGLGFGMNLEEVLKVSSSGFLYTILGISFVLGFGYLLGKLFKVSSTNSYLISEGTAICGGSAIATIGPVVEASDEEMSVSLGTVFILNSVALIVFPMVGQAVGLSQEQFGLWAALAIHDTSSVVGAGLKYGTLALSIATTVKLARALWIAPLALATSVLKETKNKIKYPYFILFFILAALINTYLSADWGFCFYPNNQPFKNWFGYYIIFNRKQYFQKNAQNSWNSPFIAGNNFMDGRHPTFIVADP